MRLRIGILSSRETLNQQEREKALKNGKPVPMVNKPLEPGEDDRGADTVNPNLLVETLQDFRLGGGDAYN